MIPRLTAIVGLLGVELLAASLAFDGASISGQSTGLLAALRDRGAFTLRWAIATSIAFVVMTLLQRKTLTAQHLGASWQPSFLPLHVAAVTGFFGLGHVIYSGAGANSTVALWLLAAVVMAASAALTFIPLDAWRRWLELTGPLWWMAALAGGAAVTLGDWIRQLWKPATALTFSIVAWLLTSLTPTPVLKPEKSILGTERFKVMIAAECSGLEGMGLFLVFSLLWMAIFKSELKFPHAFIVIPVGLVTSYLLNSLRVFSLLAVGHFGFADVALRGFHSQAGWIAFCAVATALLWASRKVSWILKDPPQAARATYPAAPYLLPFMAIMAAGILAQSASAHFEWLYPLRVAAGAAALFAFRSTYRHLDWRFGWDAVAAGVAIFLLWIASASRSPMDQPAELAAAHPALQAAWIACRFLGAALTVPIAEELAFRGFLWRRIVAEDFDQVSWRAWTWTSLLASSLLFGLLHGPMWPAGTIAGLLYAAVTIRRQRLGEAVAAHAITNALLAAYVLLSGRWDLW